MSEKEPELIARAKKDPSQFVYLYDEYVDVIFAYTQRELGDRELALEITAVTFEIALRKLHTFRWRGVPFAAWLYKIARNEMRRSYNRSKRLVQLSEQQVEERQSVEAAVHQSQLVAQVRDAMTTLSQRDQEVLRLCYDEQLTHAEIAVVLNCSTRNVAVRLHRALTRIRKAMGVERLAIGD